MLLERRAVSKHRFVNFTVSLRTHTDSTPGKPEPSPLPWTKEPYTMGITHLYRDTGLVATIRGSSRAVQAANLSLISSNTDG